jgi:hypothetical protein
MSHRRAYTEDMRLQFNGINWYSLYSHLNQVHSIGFGPWTGLHIRYSDWNYPHRIKSKKMDILFDFDRLVRLFER